MPRLRTFALALTRSLQDADDLVQTTYERALSRAAQWEPGTRLDSWLFRIMHTGWINEVHSRKVRVRHRQDLSPDESASDGEGAAESRPMMAQMERRIGGLPEKDRAILVLVCVEGLTYRETAEILGVPMARS